PPEQLVLRRGEDRAAGPALPAAALDFESLLEVLLEAIGALDQHEARIVLTPHLATQTLQRIAPARLREAPELRKVALRVDDRRQMDLLRKRRPAARGPDQLTHGRIALRQRRNDEFVPCGVQCSAGERAERRVIGRQQA